MMLCARQAGKPGSGSITMDALWKAIEMEKAKANDPRLSKIERAETLRVRTRPGPRAVHQIRHQSQARRLLRCVQKTGLCCTHPTQPVSIGVHHICAGLFEICTKHARYMAASYPVLIPALSSMRDW